MLCFIFSNGGASGVKCFETRKKKNNTQASGEQSYIECCVWSVGLASRAFDDVWNEEKVFSVIGAFLRARATTSPSGLHRPVSADEREVRPSNGYPTIPSTVSLSHPPHCFLFSLLVRLRNQQLALFLFFYHIITILDRARRFFILIRMRRERGLSHDGVYLDHCSTTAERRRLQHFRLDVNQKRFSKKL